jgi:uncharacterized protein YodC (DUF2158 family)
MKKSKWKVGDLVTLSAAGKRSQQNYQVLGGFGLVVYISDHWSDNYPVRCHWIGGEVEFQTFKDYELKRYK